MCKNGFIFYKKAIRFSHVFFAVLAFIGMGFLLNIRQNLNFDFNFGDLLTLGCAITSTFHILLVGRAALKARSSFRFNIYQTFWSLLIVAPFLFYEMYYNHVQIWPEVVHLDSILSFLFLSCFVTLVAFTLQILAQKTLSSTTASLLCLLEAPFAFMFAFLLIGEKLVGWQIVGILLILLSSCLSVYMDRPKDRSQQDSGS